MKMYETPILRQVSQVEPGELFSYVLFGKETNFLKINGSSGNVVNVATWTVGYINERALVFVVGSLTK